MWRPGVLLWVPHSLHPCGTIALQITDARAVASPLDRRWRRAVDIAQAGAGCWATGGWNGLNVGARHCLDSGAVSPDVTVFYTYPDQTLNGVSLRQLPNHSTVARTLNSRFRVFATGLFAWPSIHLYIHLYRQKTNLFISFQFTKYMFQLQYNTILDLTIICRK